MSNATILYNHTGNITYNSSSSYRHQYDALLVILYTFLFLFIPLLLLLCFAFRHRIIDSFELYIIRRIGLRTYTRRVVPIHTALGLEASMPLHIQNPSPLKSPKGVVVINPDEKINFGARISN